MERVSGIEPPYPPWQGGVLPLNYTRIMAVLTRFELAIFSVTGRRDKPLLHRTIRYCLAFQRSINIPWHLYFDKYLFKKS